jgi:hypothetical protein
MKRTKVTYGQLDRVLRSFGFSCRLYNATPPPTNVYEHKETGAIIYLPPFPEKDKVMEHHMIQVRFMLDQFGIADPEALEAKLQKAG